MQDKQKKKFLFINGFNFVSEKFLNALLHASPQDEYILAEKRFDQDLIKKYGGYTNVKIVEYSLFFKNDLSHEHFDYIIYNSLTESGTNSELVDYLANFRNLIQKTLDNNSLFLLLISVNPESMESRKIDFLSSLYALTEEGIAKGGRMKIINIGDVYGPEMDLSNNLPISNFIRDSLKSKDIVIEDNVSFRYYIYIGDAIKGLFQAIESKDRGSFTLADPFDLSLSSIGLRVAEILGKRVINRSQEVTQDHVKTLPYILPGWRPDVSIEKGLENTYEWLKSSEFTKNPQEIQLHHIATEDIAPPIRNYQPPVSREIPPLQVSNTPSQSESNRTGSLRNIQDVKARMGIEPEKKNRKTSTFSFKQGANKFLAGFKKQEKESTSTYQTILHKNNIPLLITFGIILLLYITVIVPLASTVFAYITLSHNLANFPSSVQLSNISKESDQFKNGLVSLQWLFEVTGQDTRYTNMATTADTLESIVKAQEAYSTYSTPMSQFNGEFFNQKGNVSQILQTFNQNPQYDLTYNSLIIAENSLGGYNPLFPGNIQKIKSIIDSEILSTTFLKNQYAIIPQLLDQNTNYIVIISKSNNTPYTTDTISQLALVSYKNGIYQGILPLPTPKSISSTSFSEFSLSLEKQYTLNYNGIIYINSNEEATLLQIAGSTDTNNPIPILVNALQEHNHEQIFTEIKNGLESGTISFFTHSLPITKDDIISAIK